MKELVLKWETVAQLERLPHVKDRLFKRGGFTRRKEDGAFVIQLDDAAYTYVMAHGASPDAAVHVMLATRHYRND